MSTTENTVETDVSSAVEPSAKTRRSSRKNKSDQANDVKKVRLDVIPEIKELIESMRGELSRDEYLHKLLLEEQNRQTTSDDDIESGVEPESWFTTSKDETRTEVKEALGIEADEIVMSESEMLIKASELAGISVAEIQKQGRQYMGQKLITQFCKPRQGQGQAGSADVRLDQALEVIQKSITEGTYKPANGKISLTRVSQLGTANYNSAKSWAIRRGYKEMFGL